MSSLFDLPFEEPEAEPESQPTATPPPRHAGRRVLSVSALTAAVRDLLENAFPEVWVEGELSNCKRWTTGHLYFTLKDPGAQIKGVMFRSALRSLRFSPEDGLRVMLRGRVSVYDPKGEYQLVAEHMEPQGHGALQIAFDQLKRKLDAEGLFDAARKRALPALPRRIGIVTSLDGAALRDMVRVLRRRYPNAHLVIAPSRVQGEGAGREVARALRWLGRLDQVDVIIVGRGGGSLEDLWTFNEEVVARAIVAAPVPVISAVGHETDYTIADFVADLRAPTPSAAAEIVVRRKDDFCERIDRIHERLNAAMLALVRRSQGRLHALEARPGFAGARGRIAMRGRHVAELSASLHRAATALVARRGRRHELLRRQLDVFDPRHRLAAIRTRLVAQRGRLDAAARATHNRTESRFRACAARLGSLSPLAVLARGYAVCWDATRTRILRDATTVDVGAQMRVTLARGELHCTVDGTLGDNGTE